MNRYELNNRALFVNVFTMADFTAEVPPNSIVRLSLTEQKTSRQYTGGISMPILQVSLDLCGINTDHQLVWLHYSQQLEQNYGTEHVFPTPAIESFYESLPLMHDLVRAYLVGYGYKVRPGRYILPDNLRPAKGQFECVIFQKTGDTWTVGPVNYPDNPPSPTGRGAGGEGDQ